MTATAAAATWTTRRRIEHRRRDEDDSGERRDDEERLEHLREEPEADRDPREDEPAGRTRFDTSHRRIRGHDQEQDEEGIGIVETEHQRGDRR